MGGCMEAALEKGGVGNEKLKKRFQLLPEKMRCL